MAWKYSKAMGFVAALFMVGTLLSAFQSAPAHGKSRWGAGYFPNYLVQTHDGREVRFYDDLIKGKIVAINFIYTNCPDICGLQTARLAQVQDELQHRLGKDIFFYSISLDPVNDTPQKLKEFAAAFSTGPGWTFITGDPKQLHEIRYKLGERSRSLAEHRNDVVLGNDVAGEWARSSVMVDTVILARTIEFMDPVVREASRPEIARSHVPSAARIADQRGEGLWVKTCAGCHTIGMGAHVGPDLEGVLDRRPRTWLERYMVEPVRMRAEGDATALELRAAYPAVVMPDLSLNRADVDDLLIYIERQSKRLIVATTDASDAGHDHHGHNHEGHNHEGHTPKVHSSQGHDHSQHDHGG